MVMHVSEHVKYSVCRKSVRLGKEVERPVELFPSFAQQEFNAPVAATFSSTINFMFARNTDKLKSCTKVIAPHQVTH